MVLINELTVEQINAALLHLQRSKDEVVGGNKGTTIQNISISNSGGGGNNVDYSGTIKNLATNIEKNKTAIEKNASDIAKLKSDFSNIEKSVEDTLEGLVDNGISDLSFDPLTKQLTITTNDGDTYQTVIEQDIGYLSYDSATNKLILTTGNQTQEITLPYIKASEKGSANGVATLDENGRVPYSQLPESAMEFLGQWDASTNTPHLADGTGTNGDFYIVSVGGTVNFGTAQDPHVVTFTVNDRVVYEGDIAQWVRLPAGQVSSVNGQSGAVTLTASDIEYSTGVSIKDKIDANAVQSDWNVSDTSSLAYIKNKPTIPSSPEQSDWNVSDTTSLAYIKNKPSLATVATSGSYTDLSNKPTIPAAQIQSNWTQTNNACKDYIKNKPTIPTVVDVIENGNQNAASSNAVASALDVPTDAVLHYSFDDVPDYPDGIAVYKKDNDWVDSDNWNSDYNNTTFSTNNGVAKWTTTNSTQIQLAKSISNSNGKILRIKFRCSIIGTTAKVVGQNGSSYPTIASTTTKAGWNEIMCYIPSNYSARVILQFLMDATGSSVEISQIYIGDGSYNTPVIDNADGQWNGTNYGSIPGQGVSGKAIKSFLDTYKPIKNNDFKLAPPYSYSIWIKIPANFTITQYIIDGRDGTTGADEGIIFLPNKAIEVGSASGQYVQTDGGVVPIGEWVHLAVVTTVEGNGNRYKIYKNGSLIKESVTTVVNQGFKRLTVNGRYEDVDYSRCERELDDFLFFDRALSEQEVQALYLNKANTPKYYDLNNYELGNKVSMVDVSSGIIPVALCTGTTSVGKSGCCSLTFNTSTGELDGRFFSGVAQFVGQSLGKSNTRYDIALLNHSPIDTGYFNDIAYACCRTLRYNPVTCTLYACNICGNVLTPNTWITVYSSEYAEIKEMGVSGLYCFEAICNCMMGQYLYIELKRAMYYAYGRDFLPSIDWELHFPVLGRCEDVDRDNKNLGCIINEIYVSSNTISYGVTRGWHEMVSPSQTSCVNTRCFQFMFSGQHIS